MRHYPPEFKAEAVALYRSRPGATIAQIADDLGVNRETLRSWVRIDDGKTVGAHRPKTPGPTAAPQPGGTEAELAALPSSFGTIDHEALMAQVARRWWTVRC
jgi:transposase